MLFLIANKKIAMTLKHHLRSYLVPTDSDVTETNFYTPFLITSKTSAMTVENHIALITKFRKSNFMCHFSLDTILHDSNHKVVSYFGSQKFDNSFFFQHAAESHKPPIVSHYYF
jgi:hypothetical protein